MSFFELPSEGIFSEGRIVELFQREIGEICGTNSEKMQRFSEKYAGGNYGA